MHRNLFLCFGFSLIQKHLHSSTPEGEVLSPRRTISGQKSKKYLFFIFTKQTLVYGHLLKYLTNFNLNRRHINDRILAVESNYQSFWKKSCKNNRFVMVPIQDINENKWVIVCGILTVYTNGGILLRIIHFWNLFTVETDNEDGLKSGYDVDPVPTVSNTGQNLFFCQLTHEKKGKNNEKTFLFEKKKTSPPSTKQ